MRSYKTEAAAVALFLVDVTYLFSVVFVEDCDVVLGSFALKLQL